MDHLYQYFVVRTCHTNVPPKRRRDCLRLIPGDVKSQARKVEFNAPVHLIGAPRFYLGCPMGFYQGTDYQLIWEPEIEVDVAVVIHEHKECGSQMALF
jgi:hypothetical protein